MKTFNVYPRFRIDLVKGEGCYVFDSEDKKYLDLYGGHAVISIGHSHPHYVKRMTEQMQKIGFYSNSILMPLQEEYAEKLARQSGYSDYELFLCNSGAEANENALKLASFHNGKKKIIAFKGGFHGRTASALNVTDNPKLSAPINQQNFEVEFLKLNEEEPLKKALAVGDVCAVIVEGIQGVGGLNAPTVGFLELISRECKKHNTVLILDEIQSGFGRTGNFFAHQIAKIEPDLISMAKGMGNGFPIGGVLINPKIKANFGMLGTTFGGNHLACVAGLSVLEVLEAASLMENARKIGEYLTNELKQNPQVKKVKGRGLMLGVEFDFPIKELRLELLHKHQIFTGSSANPNLLRILPPLNITKEDSKAFLKALKNVAYNR
ncbi:MAG: acetylornithine aminotransferase [Flammeovirgaceae bacterium]|jgi:acetylornithine/N-succinyldiaminopimelate aminotransferase